MLLLLCVRVWCKNKVSVVVLLYMFQRLVSHCLHLMTQLAGGIWISRPRLEAPGQVLPLQLCAVLLAGLSARPLELNERPKGRGKNTGRLMSGSIRSPNTAPGWVGQFLQVKMLRGVWAQERSSIIGFSQGAVCQFKSSSCHWQKKQTEKDCLAAS